MKVTLVNPPFLSVARPAVGTSVLKSCVKQAGHTCDVLYLNTCFADLVGLDLNEWISTGTPSQWLLGDWIFSFGLYSKPYECDRYFSTVARGLPAALRLRLEQACRLADRFCDEATKRIACREPAVVGFSTSFQQTCAALAIAKRLKGLRPNILICIGGANCEGEMGLELARSFEFIDHVFSGEAELSFPALLASLSPQPEPCPEASIRTVSRTSPGSGRVHVQDKATDLHRLPFYDYDDFFEAIRESSFRNRVRPAIAFESSRGCWWGAKRHCTFCGLNGTSMAFRSKQPLQVVSELRHLSAKYGVTRFQAVDNILDVKHIKTVFCELSAGGDAFDFFYEVKANLTFEQLRDLASAGVSWVQPGIESLDTLVLTLMDKGTTLLQNVCFLRCCEELGVNPAWNMLYGFPDEGVEPYARMVRRIPFLEHLTPPARECFRIRIDRYSPYYSSPERYGIVDLRPAEAYALTYDLPDESITRLAYFFEPGDTLGIGETEIASFRDTVAGWIAKHEKDSRRPILKMTPSRDGAVIRDTRDVSVSEWTSLDRITSDVLRSLRRPRRLQSVPSELGLDPGIVDGAIDRLDRLGFVLADGDAAVSLVVEAGHRIHPPGVKDRFPGGTVDNYSSADFLRAMEWS